MLGVLEALLDANGEREFRKMFEEHSVKFAGRGDAADAAERERKAALDRCRDQISKYSERIGLESRPIWAARHPIITGAITAAVSLAVARIFG